jgi:hypothetical protein
LSRDQVLAFVQDINSIDEGSETSNVQATQEKTAELQEGTYVFKPPGQEILTNPGIVDKTVDNNVFRSLAEALKSLVKPMYETTKGYKVTPDIFLAVPSDTTQQFANALHKISFIYNNSPEYIQNMFKSTPNWKAISFNDRMKESFRYSKNKEAEANDAIHYTIATTSVDKEDPFLKEHVYQFYTGNNKVIMNYAAQGGLLTLMFAVVSTVTRVLRNIATNSQEPPRVILEAYNLFKKTLTPKPLVNYITIILSEVGELEKIKK